MAQTESIFINIIWKICKCFVGLKINKDIADKARDKRKKLKIAMINLVYTCFRILKNL